MPLYPWIVAEEELTQDALTVRAQAVSPSDNGALSWPTFFPRVNVKTTSLHELTKLDFRPVAERREWNGRGKRIPVETPDTKSIEFIPIEANDSILEREMNKLATETRGNEEIIRAEMGVSIKDRTERLALACYRRIEIDAYSVWVNGYVVQKDPESGKSVTTSFQIESGRLQTAGSAWTEDDAYEEFLAWLLDGVDAVGNGIAGVMLRRSTFNAIRASAPTINDRLPTRSELEQMITSEVAGDFRFFINENALDVFSDGGTATTRTKVFPAQKLVLVPVGPVGATAFAPVVRAMDLVRETGAAGIDVNGATVYHEASNGGRQLDIEVQLNALSAPNEQLVWGMDAGI